tara:strand:+ start:100 stop:648 length:549 start_codon:yes stop_codon:yes gene_type:complete
MEKLKNLEQKSLARGIPIIEPEKGEWLFSFIKERKPQKILELGTANGYSGIILGSSGAELTTIEIDEKIAQEAMQNFTKFKINAKIIMGDGVSIVNDLTQRSKDYYDLIFIDFAKKKYIKILENCINLAQENGYIIADNINMSGCADFKQKVLNHKRLETKIIEIKDNLSLSKVIPLPRISP